MQWFTKNCLIGLSVLSDWPGFGPRKSRLEVVDMTDTNLTDSASLPLFDGHGQSNVPVFDCHVILSFCEAPQTVTARVAKLPDVTGTGGTERDALLDVVRNFKKRMQTHVDKKETPPWLETPITPSGNEQERWIPVHL